MDPSSSIAQQEIRRTQRMMDEAKSPVASCGWPAKQCPAKTHRKCRRPRRTRRHLQRPYHLKGHRRHQRLYETVGKLAGINVLFDPDYTSRRIAIELNGVSLEEALEIISMESKTFWRTVTPNTIFVAADNPAKRKEIEQSVIKTFYMSNLSQTTELQEVVNTLRMILEISKIQPLPSQSAIVVRGTPDQIALARKLVDDLDKAKPEVIVDLAIMQVSRDKIRNLGINPPTSISVALQNNINTTTTSTDNNGTTTNPTNSTSGTSNQLNLNRLGNLNATDFTVTIPAASATAMFSDSDVKLLQNPQIRAVDGQKGSLKIGDRVPVATGSFQPGIGGVGINPLVNTQFQYLDVGVNIDITPRVHSNGEITLKVSMEISSVTSHVSIGGIDQPVIGQRKIEHEIRLHEGEVNLLGGMLEDDDIKSLSWDSRLGQDTAVEISVLAEQRRTQAERDRVCHGASRRPWSGPDEFESERTLGGNQQCDRVAGGEPSAGCSSCGCPGDDSSCQHSAPWPDSCGACATDADNAAQSHRGWGRQWQVCV